MIGDHQKVPQVLIRDDDRSLTRIAGRTAPSTTAQTTVSYLVLLDSKGRVGREKAQEAKDRIPGEQLVETLSELFAPFCY